MSRQNRMQILEECMAKYGAEIKRVIFSYVKNHSDTNDITQEVFYTVYNKFNQFKGDANIKTWIYRIAINKSNDHLRSINKQQRNLIELFKSATSTTASVEELSLQSETSNELLKEVFNLPINYREVIILYYSYQPPVDQAYFEHFLKKYEETFRYLVENNIEQKLTTYNTVDEIRVDFLEVMSLNQANSLIEEYIYEMEDGIYLKATVMPAFINTNEPFQINKINDETYEIIQEHYSELRGHVTFIFTMKMINNIWIVDSVEWQN